MIELILTGIVLPLVVSILGAWITVVLTVKVERKRMVKDIQRNVYFKALRSVSKIIENPLVIFNGNFHPDFAEISLEMEIYASSKALKKFIEFHDDIKDKIDHYQEEFESEDAQEVLNCLPEGMKDETIKDMKFNYQIYQMPNINQIISLSSKLKDEITNCLRKG